MEFDHSTETISPDDTVTTITIGGTGGLVLPAGTTAQRPTNVTGLLRWNTETGALEVSDGTSFGDVGGGTGGGAPTDASYLTLSTNATLTNERTLTFGNEFAATDGGAGGSYGVNLDRGGNVWNTSTVPSSSLSITNSLHANGVFYFQPGGTVSATGFKSTDYGRTWSTTNFPSTSNWGLALYSNGVFVLTNAFASANVYTSTDFNTWTTQTSALPTSGSWYIGTTFKNTFFIAQYSSNSLAYSLDGVRWTSVTLPATANWQNIRGGNTNLVLVATVTNLVYVSSDMGVTWSSKTLPATANWRSLAYGNGVFVAIPSSAGVTAGAYSLDDGNTWNSMVLPTGTYSDLTFGNGVFVAVSASATNGHAISRDGINWTMVPSSGSYGGTNGYIAYGGGTFVTVYSNSATAVYSDGMPALVSGQPNGLVYNDKGSLRSANGVVIHGDTINLLPASNIQAVPDGVALFARRYGVQGSRCMPAATGPSGMDYTLQPSIWRQSIALWRPPGNSTTVPGVFGFSAPTAGGTATARNVATTNALTRAKRLGYASSAAAGNYGGHYSTTAQWTLGTGTLGGFFYSCRFGVSDATIQTAARTFIGMSSSVAAPTNVSPGTLTNSIGIGKDAADTNWFIYYGGSAAQTRIDLGANFPVNLTDIIDFTIWSPPNQNGVAYYCVERITTTGSLIASGKLGPGSAGVTLPGNTTLLAHRAWRNNNTAAAAVGLDIISVYIETDW